MRKIIYVLSHSGKWKVQCDHCSFTQITDSQTEAVKIAKQHVAGLAPGSLAEIRIQGTDGQFRTEWTYGKDPFPPRG